MSETTTPLLKRQINTQLEETGNGRTLEGLCVPFNVPTTVDDGQGPYQEMFVKGAFTRAVKAPNRVWLNFEHLPGISNVLGCGVKFDERDDGLYGRLGIDEGAEGEKAIRLYRQKILESLSVEFKPMTKPKQIDGVVHRDSVHLNAVALCRQGAYNEAQVLAIRHETVAPEYEPMPEFDPELAESLGRRGFVVPRLLLGNVDLPSQ